MSVTYSTVCTRCGVDAPEVGDFGYIGTPSLDPGKTRKHTQTFGYLYAGLAALGLLTEEIEAFHAFLLEHRGHPLRQFGDDEDEEFEDDVAPAPKRTRKFVFKKGKFLEAFHVLACQTCGDVQRSSQSARLRPFVPRPLAKAEIRLFRTNCGDLESNTYHLGGFPWDDAAAISIFLERHAAHAVVARLDEGEKSRQPKAMRESVAVPPAWTPPEWAPAEHESALGRTTNADAAEALRRLFHRDPATRIAALARLQKVGDPATFGHVASMWSDPDSDVRAAAASALGALDDPRRARMLGHALLDESEAVRAAAADALRAAGIDAAHAAERAAAPRAPDPRPEIKKLPADLVALKAALLDPSADVRGKALEQLAKRSDDASRDAAFEALADPAIGMRLSAISGLARFAKRDARVVPALLEALHDHADWVASAAAKALGQLKVSAAIPPIRERLLAFPDDYQVCLDALLGIGGLEAVAAAAAALAHPSRHARGSALLTLDNFGTEAAVAHMMTALDDPDEDVRRAAAFALAAKKHAPAVPALVRAYRRPSEWERRDAVDALGQFGGPDALRVLVGALRDRAKRVREMAVTQLIRLRDERGNRALASAARRDPATAALVPKSLMKPRRTRP